MPPRGKDAVQEALSTRPWHAHWPKDVPKTIPYPEVPIHALLREAARKWPTTDVTLFYGKRITYQELDRMADRFAAGLRAIGVRPGDRVSILMPNCPQFLIALFGILRAGGIVVQTNPLYTPRELEQQYNDAGVETVVCVDLFFKNVAAARRSTKVKRVVVSDIKEYLPGLLALLYPLKKRKDFGKIVVPKEAWVHRFADVVRGGPQPPSGEPPVSLDDVAVLQYTGGTTGVPKGAMLTHRSLVVNAYQLNAWIPGTKPGDRTLAALPFFHVYGLTVVVFATLIAGGTLVVHPNPREIGALLKLVDKQRVALFPGVPTMYVAIVNHPKVAKYNLRSIRACVSGAAPLPVEVKRKFEALTGGKLVEGYGLTEASPVTHANPIFGLVKECIGIPLPDTDAKIVDAESGLIDMGVGEAGELVIRAPQVMKGYWNRPDETAKQITRDGWLFTGDIATMDADGYFTIVDRKKDMIIASGFNVYPRDVEEVLFAHPAVQEAAVIGLPDPYRGETVKAFVILKQGAKATSEEIIAYCREHLAPFKVPRSVEFVSDLPKSLVGKVLRRELRERETKKGSGASAGPAR